MMMLYLDIDDFKIIFNTNKVKQELKKFAPDFLEISDRTTLLNLADWAREESINTAFYAHERVDKVVAAFLPLLPHFQFCDKALLIC